MISEPISGSDVPVVPMIKPSRLHVPDLQAGNARIGSSRIAAGATGFLKRWIGAGFLRPITAGAIILFVTGLRLQGAPVTNADIARLLDAGMSEPVILQAIAVGQPNFDLSPDALIALKNKGATPAILSAMLATVPSAAATAQPAAAPALPLPPLPTDVMATSVEVPSEPAPQKRRRPRPCRRHRRKIRSRLPPLSNRTRSHWRISRASSQPYGNWVQLSDYGWCWQPAASFANPAWRPYCDSGQWVYTDQGWFWESNYPWGDVVFHYGRWARQPGHGWIWVPDTRWAPSWVAWRYAGREACIGWAPLPPGAWYVAGLGLTWRGSFVADADFGLGSADFCFVGCDHFWDHDFRGCILRRERAEYVWRRSIVRNGYRMNNGRLVVEGLGPQRIGLLTHRQIRTVAVRELSRREQHEHFVARQKDAIRNVEIRREVAARGNVRQEPVPPRQFQPLEVRENKIPRVQAVQPRNENARVTPPPGAIPRIEPPRQTPAAAKQPQQRFQPTRPPAQAPAATKPAPKPAPNKDERDKNSPSAK